MDIYDNQITVNLYINIKTTISLLKTESRKKRAKDWEADDYYDSDDDVFLDRTGTVERKRQKRMQQAGAQKIIHTYPGLLEEHERIMKEVERVQTSLDSLSTPAPKTVSKTDDELDDFMATLASNAVDKAKISSLKAELIRLKQDENRIRTLTNIARPAIAPELPNPWGTEDSSTTSNQTKPKLPLFGKRKKLSVKKPAFESKVCFLIVYHLHKFKFF